MRLTSVFRYAVVLCLASVLVSCAMDASSDVDSPQTQPDPSRPKPTIPIKRRPIVPGTQLPRPRVIIRVDNSVEQVVEVTPEARVAARVELYSESTAERWTMEYGGDGEAVEFAVGRDVGPFVLTVETSDDAYLELIEVE